MSVFPSGGVRKPHLCRTVTAMGPSSSRSGRVQRNPSPKRRTFLQSFSDFVNSSFACPFACLKSSNKEYQPDTGMIHIDSIPRAEIVDDEGALVAEVVVNDEKSQVSKVVCTL